MTNQSISCPACKTQLLPGKLSAGQVLLCANCGAQFCRDRTWPVVRTSRTAIASFVLGLMAFSGLFFVSNVAPGQMRLLIIPLTVVGSLVFLLGLWALGDIRRARHTGLVKGKQLAFLGASMGGALSAAILIIPLLATNNLQYRFRPRSTLRRPPPPVVAPNAVAIIALGAPWKWLHPVDGTDPATSDPDFHQTFFHGDYDDSDWGVGQESAAATGFGYGDPVVVPIGTPAANARKTAYFRHRFTTTEAYKKLMLTFYRDDGVIIYLDGKEVARDNISNAAESFELRASTAVGRRMETIVIGVAISDALKPGEHILAISLHNSEFDSTDLRVGRLTLYGVPSSSLEQ